MGHPATGIAASLTPAEWDLVADSSLFRQPLQDANQLHSDMVTTLAAALQSHPRRPSDLQRYRAQIEAHHGNYDHILALISPLDPKTADYQQFKTAALKFYRSTQIRVGFLVNVLRNKNNRLFQHSVTWMQGLADEQQQFEQELIAAQEKANEIAARAEREFGSLAEAQRHFENTPDPSTLPGSRTAVNDERTLEALANQGDAGAQFTLGTQYAAGDGVLQDYVAAHKWFNLAAAQGNNEAATAREKIMTHMTPGQIAAAQERARTWQPTTASSTADPTMKETSNIASSGQPTPEQSKEFIWYIQQLMTDLGYNPGPVDGLIGQTTRAEIRSFQTDTGHIVDGKVTPALREQLVAALKEKQWEPQANARKEAPAETTWATPRPASIRQATDLKQAPKADAPALAQLPVGTAIETLGQQGAWYRARVASATSDAEGWVRITAVQVEPETARHEAAGLGVPTLVVARKKQSNPIAGLFAGIARGVGAIISPLGRQRSSRGTQVSTIGIRGLNASELQAAYPDPLELQKLHGFAVSEQEAMEFAAEMNLTRRVLEYLPAPERIRNEPQRVNEKTWPVGLRH